MNITIKIRQVITTLRSVLSLIESFSDQIMTTAKSLVMSTKCSTICMRDIIIVDQYVLRSFICARDDICCCD